MGKPGFPTPCARAAPSPSHGRRDGETRFPHPLRKGCALTFPRAEGWGNPVSPPSSSRAYVHVSRPCGCAAPRWDEHPSWEGCALPNPPAGGLRPHLPAGGGMGKPGSAIFTLGASCYNEPGYRPRQREAYVGRGATAQMQETCEREDHYRKAPREPDCIADRA